MNALITRKYDKKASKEIKDLRLIKTVEINGYQYVLVECDRRDGTSPCALGHRGYVIKEVKKLKKKNNEQL